MARARRALAAALVLGAVAGCTGADRSEVALVRLTDSGFDPPALTVAAGTEVRWVNDGSMARDVTPIDPDRSGGAGAEWGTDRLLPGETLAHVFDRTGGYPYRSASADGPDPFVGVVTVETP
jgi:plastocyanin